MNKTVERYSTAMIAIHWSTAIAVLIAYILSVDEHEVRNDPPLLHFAFGLSVLILLFARLIARSLKEATPAGSSGERWLSRWARHGHVSLYLLLVFIPLSGWYVASRMGLPANLFGLTLPPLTGSVKGSPGLLGQLHKWSGNLILIVAGLHAGIAFWHHFAVGDRTLKRMSPF